MRFFGLRRFAGICAATAVALAAVCAARVGYACKLSRLQGARTFYLYSASSQAVCKRSLSAADIWFVRGECVRFKRANAGTDGLATATEIAETFGGEILFVEYAGGTLSAYGYAKGLQGGVEVNGRLVNLHIAVGETQCAVGTPLLFDGF